MATDGTGGLVYRRRDQGRSHIFVARYVGQRWQRPVRVDYGQRFDSTWPRIAAGSGGRLLVTWVQEFGPSSDRLYSASLDPGSRSFEAPIPVDLNVREATGTYPALAMNDGGTAYIVYRVVTATPIEDAMIPAGYVRADLRVSRLSGYGWSSLGRQNRNADTPVHEPDVSNAPQITITEEASGMVAFNEPDDGFVDRVWARRLFGSSSGNPLQVSPQSFNGAPVTGAANSFALAGVGFGQAAISFQQEPGGAFSSRRVMVNSIAERFEDGSGQFKGAKLVDASGTTGPTSVATAPSGEFAAAFSVGNATFLGTGGYGAVDQPKRLDDGSSSVGGDPVTVMGGRGAIAAAWKLRGGSGTGVALQERPLSGKVRRGRVSAPKGGTVNELKIAGSGLGDGLVAFRQGSTAEGQIAATTVDAPPGSFAPITPIRFVKPNKARFTWDPAPDALGGVSYTPVLDGRRQDRDSKRRSYRMNRRGLEDGTYEVRIVATDSAGQQTLSEPADLKVDGTPPRATVTVRGRSVSVRVADGKRSRSSRPRAAGTTISFGDGNSVRRKLSARHTYRRGGTFKIVVKANDRAGNSARIVRTVRVR